MRRIFIMCLVPAIAVHAAAQASDSQVVSLPRQGGWEVNYDTDACNVFGVFGTGEDQTIIGLTRFSPGDSFDMGLIGKPVNSRNPQTAIEIGYGDNPARIEAGTAGRAAGKLPMIVLTGQRLDGWRPTNSDDTPPAVTPAQEAAVRAITFRQKGGKRYRLETGSLAKPMEAMRACTADLIKSWGYDPAVQANLTRPALPASNPDLWFRSIDYPIHSAMQGHNGVVQARLDVDPSGKVTGCRVLRRTEPDEFADVTCEVLMKRAKLSPALDAAGNPVKSYYMFKLHFVSLNNN